MKALLHDPLLILAMLVGFLGISASLVLSGVLLHLRRLSCENTNCIHHPHALKGSASFDFSSIGTPAELVGASRSEKEAEAVVTPQPEKKEVLPSAPDSVVSALEWTDEQIEESDNFDLEDFDFSITRPEFGNPELEDVEIEEPHERPSMDFTDDMVFKVCATLERQQELERQAIERQVVEHRRRLEQQALERRRVRAAYQQAGELAAQAVRQAFPQQPQAEQAPHGEREPLPQGRHFRPAAVPLGAGEGTTLENLADHRPADMKHSLDKEAEERLQRVS
jgi:hypothetical protein